MSNQITDPVFAATWAFGAQAVRVAREHWQEHQSLEAACVEATAAVELHPEVPTVGIGGLPNREGVMELDAGFMRGSDLRCGSVAALRVTCPAIRVARQIAELPHHSFLAGQGADTFALNQGFTHYEPKAMLTEQTRAEYAAWTKEVDEGLIDGDRMVGHDTLGLLGWADGQTIACVATSGLGFKRPGRVGDSPIIGGGLYADDEAGCVACTGIGEELARHAAAVRVIDAMKSGMSPDAACRSVLSAMIRRDPKNATRGLSMIAIDRHGTPGAATTRAENHLFEYHVCKADAFERVVPTPCRG